MYVVKLLPSPEKKNPQKPTRKRHKQSSQGGYLIYCHRLSYNRAIQSNGKFKTITISPLHILGDPGAHSRVERQIKETKSVRAKVYETGGRAPGRLHLTD